ncbi:MAG: hypothetical protein IPI60_01350 [Saprospiraceae bacterium]|nr:hypothetical protein [Saprospiraceae bacterium]
MRTALLFMLFGSFAITGCTSKSEKESTMEFQVTWEDGLAEAPQSGRLLILLSTNSKEEPRFQITDGHDTQIVFGMDVENWNSGETVVVGSEAFGYPYEKLADLPEGEYYVQALLNRYQTFNLSTGHAVLLPPEKGEGQQWNQKPGNFYSAVQKISIKHSGEAIVIHMDKVIEDIPAPEDTKYIKHIKMKSELLSKFWGEPVELGAHVLLPEGFDEHPEAKYPVIIFHGHFPSDFGGFRTTPPDADMEPVYSDRFGVEGYNIVEQQEAYDFYRQWISPEFPRVIIVEIQHANPYYDDSYAVNSANLGPYGDAITYELIPHIEKQFRGIGEGWARFLYGGSTGGWEALAVQMFYPDEYNGCFAACPDPIDFRAYCLVDIYKDKNAYFYESEHKKLERPGFRNNLGQVSATLRSMNYKELALGTKGRSGQQWDIWEAVYSPQGSDGYPKRLWDKYTGEIDPDVAAYWKENYDLRYILERDWAKLGPKLKGKINIYCGDMDNYYLNNAVYLMEDFLETTKNPPFDGEVDYGDRAEHCWNGDQENPIWISRLRYNTFYLPKIMDRIQKSAPSDADLTSWRY